MSLIFVQLVKANFGEFRCLTGSSLGSLLRNSPMLIPICRGNNVDLQHILHFDLHPSMTAIYRGHIRLRATNLI